MILNSETKIVAVNPGCEEVMEFDIRNFKGEETIYSDFEAEVEIVGGRIKHYTSINAMINGHPEARGMLKAKKVIFNPPATIVLWEDGTKTVVKCDDKDWYNAMTGVALCYMKKALGNTSKGLNEALHSATTIG